MIWIFLSPHFDDIALSCGGLVWELSHQGNRVEIWTICSGLPPALPLTPFARQLHDRWGTEGPETVELRRREDEEACRRLGALPRTFGVPDCIYRRLPGSNEPLIRGEEDLYAPVHPAEAGLISGLARDLRDALPTQARLVSPLGLGGHVDHRLTRAAAETQVVRDQAGSLAFYADYPYVIRTGNPTAQTGGVRLKTIQYPVSPEALEAWQAAVAAYSSQLSTFWTSLAEMRTAIAEFGRGGVKLFAEERGREEGNWGSGNRATGQISK